ncbi:MAG: hypothetical protein IJ225_05765 [Solobacterium sp.]|nr:hypothetical protein [Solobacterium sp.]
MKQIIIREAGGVYWLIKADQSGTYVPPMMVNDSAAELIRLLLEGNTPQESARILSEGEDDLIPVILNDIQSLCEEVQKQLGVPIGA